MTRAARAGWAAAPAAAEGRGAAGCVAAQSTACGSDARSGASVGAGRGGPAGPTALLALTPRTNKPLQTIGGLTLILRSMLESMPQVAESSMSASSTAASPLSLPRFFDAILIVQTVGPARGRVNCTGGRRGAGALGAAAAGARAAGHISHHGGKQAHSQAGGCMNGFRQCSRAPQLWPQGAPQRHLQLDLPATSLVKGSPLALIDAFALTRSGRRILGEKGLREGEQGAGRGCRCRARERGLPAQGRARHAAHAAGAAARMLGRMRGEGGCQAGWLMARGCVLAGAGEVGPQGVHEEGTSQQSQN